MSKQLYCTKNDCYKVGAKLKSVSYLIVHSPAVYPVIIRAESGSGGGWYKRWNKPGVEKLVHGFIDDTGVYEFAPETLSCWHIGNGWGNANTIGYELCELDTRAEFEKVWQNAVKHYAVLCEKYGLSSDKVIGHQEAHKKGIASNHSDPEPYFRRFGKSMDAFRADVKKSMSEQPTKPTTETERPAAIPSVTKTYDPWAYARICNLTKADPTLNVRSGPGVEYGVIRQLANENEVDVIARYANGWAKINIVGVTGYVNAHYLDIKTQASKPVQTPVKPAPAPSGYTDWVGKVYHTGKPGLNVRTGPGTNYSKLSAWPKLLDDNLISVIGESGNWYQIKIADKHIGWASKDYITKV